MEMLLWEWREIWCIDAFSEILKTPLFLFDLFFLSPFLGLEHVNLTGDYIYGEKSDKIGDSKIKALQDI